MGSKQPIVIQLLGQSRSGKENQAKSKTDLLNNSVLPFCNKL